MIKRLSVCLILFYFLVLWQTSFAVHFSLFGIVPNFTLMLVVLINLFEKRQGGSGLLAAFWGGFFLDVFSSGFLGLNVLILVALSFFIKMVLKKYVQAPTV